MLAVLSCSIDSITGCKPLHMERTKTTEVHELVIAVFKAVYVTLFQPSGCRVGGHLVSVEHVLYIHI